MISLVTLHLSAVVFSFAVLILADTEALLWLIGKKQTLNAVRIKVFHTLMWIGLLMTMSLGILIAYPLRDYLLTYPLFLMKLMFVGILVTNAFLIGMHMRIATLRSFASLSFAERLPLFISGAVSTIGWMTVATIGWFLF